ncbi:glycoside hydrolase family 92 protein [Flammeovirga pectinis]|uniref:Glycoside hydrolase family 92 protein n=1 Tax=Flammeovirga pectinis TaxID=2494373 RepID=A0A3Q9FVL4_9BACT|nr:GH92 family glycosyl hydrolase [Flammeovirga pectinis]AZQ65438.1 glycoside hydrolase family 92 protein [Flammeovirga pectinis]
MKNFLLTSFNYLLILFICTSNIVQAQNKDYTSFVNPFIGTQNMGHTYPGATTPFGMVQLSPETNQEAMLIDGKYNPATYAYCAGYQYADSTIFGFSHTHMSGTGHSDLGDFLLMPTTGALRLNPGTADQPQSGYHSQFSHQTEEASPGYYAVTLDDYNIKAELTTSDRVGYHRYTFPKSDDAHIILDLISNIYNYEGKTVWTFVRVENDSTVTGYRQTNGWGKTRKVFFAMKFSKPFKSYGHKRYEEVKYNGFYRKFDQEHNFPEMAGEKIRAYFNFDTEEQESIDIKFALSSVSTAGALLNLATEIPHWNFDKTKEEARKKWNTELSKVEVETLTEDQKVTFYTAFYHTMLSPVLYEDVDGQYRGLDQNIYTSEGFTNYTLFSLWDTYRALHPLFNVLHPTRNNDMVKSMLAHQEQSVHNMLPIWSHYANENWCMIGYHAVSVIADAMVKETTDVSPQRALDAAVSTATVTYFDGIGDYIANGYVSADNNSASVSKTLEYAYDDFCISEIAKYAGREGVSSQFHYRSENFKNVFDSVSNYMRPKMQDGTWRTAFDPLDTHGQGFIEGNAWNYGLYVPHNVDEMITMMGGKDHFSSHLDKIFTTPIEERFIEKNEDITRDGIIGNYVHGNEPGHHIPYLYNWTNQPEKTQQRVRMIMDTMYTNERDGLCGNDDAGQMSAWYVFSAIGFYPVLPGSAEYALGSPLVKEATLHFENGNTLHIVAKNQSSKNVYVKKILLNGVEITGPTINHFELMKGGELVFEMSRK